MQTKSLFGSGFVSGTKFELKTRFFKSGNKMLVMGLFDPLRFVGRINYLHSFFILKTLNILAVSNPVIHFFWWKNQKNSVLSQFYASVNGYLGFAKGVLFYPLLSILFCWNLLLYTFTRVGQVRYSGRTKVQVFSSRDMLFELLKQAEDDKREVTYLDIDNNSGRVVETLVKNLFPDLIFESYLHDPKSLVLQSNSNDFYVLNPHWYEVKTFLEKKKRDVLIIALREDGFGEFEFIEKLVQSNTVQFASALLTDVQSLTEEYSENRIQRNLRSVFQISLEEMLTAIDTGEKWCYEVQLAIQKDDQMLLDEYGEKPSFFTANLANLEIQMVKVVGEMVQDVKKLKVAGKVVQKKQPRILPTLRDVRLNALQYARRIIVQVPFKFTGSDADVLEPYRFAKIDTY